MPNILDNPEAEQSVLGALLIRPDGVGQVADVLTPSDFYREAHGLIFRAIQELHEKGEPVDLVTVTQSLKNKGQLEKTGGAVFLAGLSEQVGFATNVLYYADVVKSCSQKRQLKLKLQTLLTQIEKPDTSIDSLFDLADSQLQELITGSNNGNRANYCAISANDLLSQELYAPPDIIGAGIMPQGSGVFLTGDSGIGKSLLTLELAVKLSEGVDLWGLPVKRPIKVLIVQAENPDHSMQFRLKRIISGLSLAQAPRLFLTPSDLRLNLSQPKNRNTLKDLISRTEAELVILDPLISYHATPENDNSQMRSFLDSLTDISRSSGAAWLLVHHHGRPQDGESRFRGASAIKDWADSFLTLAHKTSRDRTLLELTFAKIRHGAGRAPLILERDSNFLHFPTEEDGIAPPSLVITALQQLGGQCTGQALLVDKIMAMTGCKRSTAYQAIKNAALGKGIDETEHGGKKIYFVQKGFGQKVFHNSDGHE
ncbi:MAG: DnaB-like helicase N-terminal domain-containing protein [Thermodesulfobacteriota bacterium]